MPSLSHRAQRADPGLTFTVLKHPAWGPARRHWVLHGSDSRIHISYTDFRAVEGHAGKIATMATARASNGDPMDWDTDSVAAYVSLFCTERGWKEEDIKALGELLIEHGVDGDT